jgi:hypothetical protein
VAKRFERANISQARCPENLLGWGAIFFEKKLDGVKRAARTGLVNGDGLRGQTKKTHTMSHFEISWNQIRRGAHSSEEIGDVINGSFNSLEEAVAEVKRMFKNAGGRDELGMWWEVVETDDDGNGTIVFTSEVVA